MAFVNPPAPGAILSGSFTIGTPGLREEVSAFIQKAEGLLRSGAMRAFVCARRLEGQQLWVDLFPAEAGDAGAITSMQGLDQWQGATAHASAEAEHLEADWGLAAEVAEA